MRRVQLFSFFALAFVVGLLTILGLSTPDASAQDVVSGTGLPACDTLSSLPSGESPLRVATKPLSPFVFIDDEPLRGFSVDYWHEVGDRLGVETLWCTQETVGEIVDLTALGRVDAAIAGISITREREEVIDFSQPYYTSGLQLVIEPGGASTARTLFGLIFSSAFLVPVGVLILLVLIVSHLVWWFERRHDSDDFPHSYRQGIGEAIWWSTVSVITGGEAVKNINRAASRLIAIFWMLVGLFLLAFVTARATSLLTVAELEGDIAGLEDLRGNSVTTVEGTSAVDILRRDAGVEPRQAVDLDTALDDLAAGRTDAVAFDAPVVQYVVNRERNDDFLLVEPISGRDPYGIALPQGSELVESVNAAVIEIGRDGTLDTLIETWFGEN